MSTSLLPWAAWFPRGPRRLFYCASRIHLRQSRRNCGRDLPADAAFFIGSGGWAQQLPGDVLKFAPFMIRTYPRRDLFAPWHERIRAAMVRDRFSNKEVRTSPPILSPAGAERPARYLPHSFWKPIEARIACDRERCLCLIVQMFCRQGQAWKNSAAATDAADLPVKIALERSGYSRRIHESH
jgi:hypothetical protein